MIDINEKLYTTESRRHTYRIVGEEEKSLMIKWLGPKIIYTGVQFYDHYCKKWRDSIVTKAELIELRHTETNDQHETG